MGLGDTILRIFYKPDSLKGFLNLDWMVGAEAGEREFTFEVGWR